MKKAKFYIASVILLLLGIVILQNREIVNMDLLWWHGKVRLIFLLLGVAISSSIMTYLWMIKKGTN